MDKKVKAVIAFVVIVTVIALGAMILILGGLLYKHTDKLNKKLNINEEGLAYMEQKYGEKFEYDGPWGNSMTGTHEFLVQCDSLPGESIVVEIENYKQDNKIFRDNYLAVKYREDTINFIRDCANQVLGETTVFYRESCIGLSPYLPATATFEEYLADTSGYIGASIEVKASAFVSREQVEKIAEPIASTCKADLMIRIIFVEDYKYGTLDMDTLGDELVFNKYVHCMRIERLDDGSIKIDWREKKY